MALMDFELKDVGGIFTSIREAITGKKIVDPMKLLSEINRLEGEYLKARSNIIVAEASSQHWLVSAWRPITMLVFVFIIFSNYVIVPYAGMFGIEVPALDIPPDMWGLLKIGLGGYIVGRSMEKGVDTYTKNKVKEAQAKNKNRIDSEDDVEGWGI